MKKTPGKYIYVSAGVAIAAALVLGLLALVFSRNEAAVRREEARELARSEGRLFGAVCVREIELICNDLIDIASVADVYDDSWTLYIDENPFIVAAFATDGEGLVFFPGDYEGEWRTRYRDLFDKSIPVTDMDDPAVVIMPGDEAAIYLNNTVEYVNSDSSLEVLAQKSFRLSRQNVPSSSVSNANMRVFEKNEAPKAAAEPEMVLADAIAPEETERARYERDTAAPSRAAFSDISFKTPDSATRFEVLVRDRSSGYIPWFSGNRITPLVWARNLYSGTITGFEIDATVLWSRMIPLFPDNLPEYIRIELIDHSGRVIHSAGAPVEFAEEASPVLVMPFGGMLLPNSRIQVAVIPGLMPGKLLQAGMIAGILSLLITILAAAWFAVWMFRRELRLAEQKSSFVAQVSHELKTPLTSIRMYSELLEEHSPRLDEEKKKGYLNIISRESDRLSRMVGNVLDFSRLSEGRRRYSTEIVDLVETGRLAVDVYRQLLKNKDVELVLHLPGAPAEAAIDRDSLMQVLYNLLDNAVKYGAAGGRIELSLYKSTGRWNYKLRDFGSGVPQEARHKIFHRFYRADDSITGETSGLGLGLSIARSLMRDQGGDIIYQPSDPGSEFIILLPPGDHEDGTNTYS